MDIAKIIDDKKFMWDGKIYEGEKEAQEVKTSYEKDNFETRIVYEEGKYFVFTRRVVTEVVVEGQPPV